MPGESASVIQTHFHGEAVAQKVVPQESVSHLQLQEQILL